MAEGARDPFLESWAVGDVFEPTFLELYQEHFAPMVRLAVVLTGVEASAEDLVHDTFIRVHARWRRIENPPAYLRRSVVNACRSSRRRARRERRAASFAVQGVVDLDANELFDALGRLPYRQRAALVLRYYEGLTHAEIAEVLECREGTASSLIHRGLAQLRRTVGR